MHRKLFVIALCGLSVAARAQAPPSDEQILSDQFGEYDAKTGTITWRALIADLTKFPNNMPASVLHDGQKARVELVDRINQAETVFAETAVLPLDTYECHACTVPFGLALYQRRDGAWQLAANTPVMDVLGGWGNAPELTRSEQCGMKTQCAVVVQSDLGQGFSSEVTHVYAPRGNRIVEVGSWETGEDDTNAYDPNQRPPHSTQTFVAAVKFSRRYPVSDELFPVEVTGTRTRCRRGTCVKTQYSKRYFFTGTKYVEARSRAARHPVNPNR